MPDDEPVDDARAVAVAAAAAAARVVETVARAAADREAQQLASLQHAHNQQQARQALQAVRESLPLTAEERPEREANLRREHELGQVEARAKTSNPDAWQAYGDSVADSPDAHRSAENNLIWRWKNETKPYDDPERRQAADEVSKADGVPAEARDVRATADLMNGHEPCRRSSLDDLSTWYKTGSEAATKRQIHTLQRLGVDPSGLTKAGASKVITAPDDARMRMAEVQRVRSATNSMNRPHPIEAAAHGKNMRPAAGGHDRRPPGREADPGR